VSHLCDLGFSECPIFAHFGAVRTNRDSDSLCVYVDKAAKIVVESETTPTEVGSPLDPEKIDQLLLDDLSAIAEKVKNKKPLTSANMRSLIMVLADPILSGDSKREEFNFQQIVNAAQNNELFDWMLDGKDIEQHEAGSLVRSDYVLKSDSKSKFGKLLKRYLPYAGELQGPRHRAFWFGQGDQRRQVKTSSLGRTGRRKFIIELAK
jgi:hypothetical protein